MAARSQLLTAPPTPTDLRPADGSTRPSDGQPDGRHRLHLLEAPGDLLSRSQVPSAGRSIKLRPRPRKRPKSTRPNWRPPAAMTQPGRPAELWPCDNNGQDTRLGIALQQAGRPKCGRAVCVHSGTLKTRPPTTQQLTTETQWRN